MGKTQTARAPETSDLENDSDKNGAAENTDLRDFKPLLRGWIHTGTGPTATAGGVVLISLARGPVAKWAAAVFMFTSLLLFGISSIYHRFNWSPRVKQVFRRLDHANIFLLIAGTYTPIALLALPLEKGIIL